MNKRNILYVEDDERMRTLVGIYFEGSDYSFDFARNGIEGLNKGKDPKYHLIITDNRMPKMSGIEMAISLRKNGIKSPIVLLSGTILEDLAEKDRNHFSCLLDKSILGNPNRFVSLVKELAEGKYQNESNRM